MSRTRRLTQTERAEIIREAGEGVGTSELAERFGVTPRAIQYTLKADEDRQKDAAVATAAVTVKLTPKSLVRWMRSWPRRGSRPARRGSGG